MKKVFMYTLSTCPWCHKAKKYFTDHHIPFQYVDYERVIDCVCQVEHSFLL